MTDQTDFQQACAERGWATPGRFLRVFAETAALIGEPVTITDRQLRRWRKPHPPRPRSRAWRVLHAMFGISPLVLGFPGPEPTDAADTAAGGHSRAAGVARRGFVADTLGAAAGLALVTSTSDAVGTAHMEELREGLRSLYALDDAYGGEDVRSLAARHLRRIRRVINTGSYPVSIGRQLELLGGETAEQCAWLSYDADDQESARHYWGEALTTATMLRDASLEVLVLASLSMQATYEERPRDGYNLARAARQRAEGMASPVLLSLIAAREARALAVMRDGRAARQGLSQAMRLVERADRGRPPPEWAAFHGPAELEYAHGLMYADEDRHTAAVPFLRAALAHQDRAYGRNRALYRLTLARGLIKTREVDEGAAEAMGALEQLAEVESQRVNRRVVEVRNLLDAADTAVARETSEALAAYVR
ncbi:hypothetical protein [Streptomyces sp. NPDC004134]|uniref:hypothetical protein n=1 Tax=Streptomyces sp. NPDC004134 TaxID=3364691 RepID=UPI0036BF8150